jgi:hypothetical protein
MNKENQRQFNESLKNENLEIRKAILPMITKCGDKEMFFFFDETENKSFAIACPKGTLETWQKEFEKSKQISEINKCPL